MVVIKKINKQDIYFQDRDRDIELSRAQAGGNRERTSRQCSFLLVARIRIVQDRGHPTQGLGLRVQQDEEPQSM
jgi:hypothetical protein